MGIGDHCVLLVARCGNGAAVDQRPVDSDRICVGPVEDLGVPRIHTIAVTEIMVDLGVIAIAEGMIHAISAVIVNRSCRGNQAGTAKIISGTPRRVAEEVHDRGIEPALGKNIAGKWR